MDVPGGARSLSIFDNDIGSGSISPLIVTGGKSGDVGLHDFRYIATGRTKKHKHCDTSEQNLHSTVDMQKKTGDQNRNGMLWYIPKAHTGTCYNTTCTIAAEYKLFLIIVVVCNSNYSTSQILLKGVSPKYVLFRTLVFS